jgi:very-short-patch-repair endonuclease
VAKQNNEISPNVLSFIEHCSVIVSGYEHDSFSQKLFGDCFDVVTDSPIEQILYCAIKTVLRVNFIHDTPTQLPIGNGNYIIRGVEIIPQKKIDNYRCDFEITGFPEKTSVIVECDSQIYHERNEKERRYEKARDRFFVMNGYKVFHYTGSEIVKNAYKIAIEIISYVTGLDESDLEYPVEIYKSEG